MTPLVTPETVDLARLNDVGELVEAPAVPYGNLHLGARRPRLQRDELVWLNVNGQTDSRQRLNPAGTVASATTVVVTFDPQHPLVIPNGTRPPALQIDVDLTASNSRQQRHLARRSDGAAVRRRSRPHRSMPR